MSDRDALQKELYSLVQAIIADGADNGTNTSVNPWVKQISALLDKQSDIEIGQRAVRLGLMTPQAFYDRFEQQLLAVPLIQEHYEATLRAAKRAAGIDNK